MTTPSLSCIIPAYNEKDRIGSVLQTVSAHPMIDEVIVIDDASHDGTADVAEQFTGVTLIRQTTNQGKTYAVSHGLEAAKGSHVLLVDADLTGLNHAHLTALIEPVLRGSADISISLRDNAPRVWRMIGLDYISGERVIS